MRAYSFFILICLVSCSFNSFKKPINRQIASLEFPISEQEEEEIVERAYKCLDKVKYLDGNEVDFKKDSSAITEAFKVCLSEYIKIKTISPAGDEHKGVIYWSTIFENLNIPYKVYTTPTIDEAQKQRYNLVATLPANNEESDYDWSADQKSESIIITHHMDVVNVLASQWLSEDLPFSGKIMNDESGREFVYGRGAFDMKGIGIAHFLAFYTYWKNTRHRKNDIHFLALADEEEKGSGAIGTLKLMGPGKPLHALSRAKILLNEGGGVIDDIPKKGVTVAAISTEQKGGAWLKVSRDKPLKLFKSLNKLGLLHVNKKKERKNKIDKKYKCSVKKITGPEPKVNVVTSKLSLELDCKKDKKISLKSKKDYKTINTIERVIKKGYPKVAFKVDQIGSVIKVDIDTQSSSHGSTSLAQSAIDVLATTLYRLRIFKMKRPKNPKFFKHKRSDATKAMLKALAPYDKTLKIFNKLSFIPFVRRIILKEVEKEFGFDGFFKTNCNLTNFIYAKEAQAYLDCRLLHTGFKYKDSDNHAQKFVKQLLRKKLLEFDFKIEMISGWNFTSSPTDSKDFKKLIEVYKKEIPNGVVTQYLNPAGSDSAWFRNPKIIGILDVEPIPSYGVFPANFTVELIGALHGSNERFPVDQMTKSVERFYKILEVLDY